jgi:hypothetical protein
MKILVIEETSRQPRQWVSSVVLGKILTGK